MSDGYLSKDLEHLARLQRERRARLRRVDYMPSPEALAVIEAKRAQHRPGSAVATNSAVIDAIVTAWAALTGINNQKIERPMTPAASAGINRHDARAYDFGAIENNAKQSRRVPCGARRHRDGLPCKALSEPGKRRCRFHGGRSTGPQSPDGKARALANLRRGRGSEKSEASEPETGRSQSPS
ncbi:HGGxSTG domain-containing protein [Lysobacter sp. P5_B9]